jgi:hypothetical protein
MTLLFSGVSVQMDLKGGIVKWIQMTVGTIHAPIMEHALIW